MFRVVYGMASDVSAFSIESHCPPVAAAGILVLWLRFSLQDPKSTIQYWYTAVQELTMPSTNIEKVSVFPVSLTKIA